jgi:secreted trypsin-like serine protease
LTSLVALFHLSKLFFSLKTPVCGLAKEDHRIIGGEYVPNPQQYPWSVSLEMKTEAMEVFHCSASLLSDQWILTAAHCHKPTASRFVHYN